VSQENVDFVRGLFDGAAGVDKASLLELLPQVVPQAFTEDAEWIEDPTRVDQKIWHGHAGICESWRAWLDEWDEYGFEVSLIENHGSQVFVAAREDA